MIFFPVLILTILREARKDQVRSNLGRLANRKYKEKILTKISIFLVIRVGKFSEIFFTYFVMFWERLSVILSNPVYD